MKYDGIEFVKQTNLSLNGDKIVTSKTGKVLDTLGERAPRSDSGVFLVKDAKIYKSYSVTPTISVVVEVDEIPEAIESLVSADNPSGA